MPLLVPTETDAMPHEFNPQSSSRRRDDVAMSECLVRIDERLVHLADVVKGHITKDALVQEQTLDALAEIKLKLQGWKGSFYMAGIIISAFWAIAVVAITIWLGLR